MRVEPARTAFTFWEINLGFSNRYSVFQQDSVKVSWRLIHISHHLDQIRITLENVFAVLPLKRKDSRMWNVDTPEQKSYWLESHRSVESSIQHSVCRDNHIHPAAALLRFSSASLSSTLSQEEKEVWVKWNHSRSREVVPMNEIPNNLEGALIKELGGPVIVLNNLFK